MIELADSPVEMKATELLPLQVPSPLERNFENC